MIKKRTMDLHFRWDDEEYVVSAGLYANAEKYNLETFVNINLDRFKQIVLNTINKEIVTEKNGN